MRDRLKRHPFSISVAVGSTKREEGSIGAGFVNRPGDHRVGKRRDHEQVHRRDLGRMVPEEGPPALAGRPAMPSHHVLRDSGLSHLEAELQKLTVDARAPQSGLSALICAISALSSASIWGRPPRLRDLQRR